MPGSVVHRFIAALYQHKLDGAEGCAHVARIAATHLPSLYAGAYEGADCQIMPGAFCELCGRVVAPGYSFEDPRCEYCGATLHPYRFHFAGQDWDAARLQGTFYVRSHLGLPCPSPHADRSHLPLAGVRAVLRNVLRDAFDTAHASALIPADSTHFEQAVAFTLGWLTHVVSDMVMKGFWPEPVANTAFVDGLYGPRSRMAWEVLILHNLAPDLRISPQSLLLGLPGAEDNGILLHYMMVNDPARYARWDPPVPAWSARPDQCALLAAHLLTHRPFFAVIPLTSQYVAEQLAHRPLHERVPISRLEKFTLDGMDIAALIALARRAGAPEALAAIADLAVAETTRALCATS